MGDLFDDEPQIYHTPFGTTNRAPYMSPEWIETTNLGEPFKRYMDVSGTSLTYTGSTGDTKTIHYPAIHWPPPYSTITYEDLMKHLKREEETSMKIDSVPSSKPNEHIVVCKNKDDLVPDKILTTLSAVKGKLLFEIAPVPVKDIQCNITPKVKEHLIMAGRRLKMYGKKTPIVPNFDEMGNRLPDTIEIGDNKEGITLNIVDPEIYGDLYLELKAIHFHVPYYKEKDFDSDIDSEDLPF